LDGRRIAVHAVRPVRTRGVVVRRPKGIGEWIGLLDILDIYELLGKHRDSRGLAVRQIVPFSVPKCRARLLSWLHKAVTSHQERSNCLLAVVEVLMERHVRLEEIVLVWVASKLPQQVGQGPFTKFTLGEVFVHDSGESRLWLTGVRE